MHAIEIGSILQCNQAGILKIKATFRTINSIYSSFQCTAPMCDACLFRETHPFCKIYVCGARKEVLQYVVADGGLIQTESSKSGDASLREVGAYQRL